MKSICRFASILALCTVGALSPDGVRAQDYPNKPVRIVVPSSPGASNDLFARLLAPELSKIMGQNVVVENRAGGGDLIGYTYVALQAPADGYTILFGNLPNMAVTVVTVKDLQFDLLKELPPVAQLAEGTLVLASPSSAPWKNFNEFTAVGKANPGKYFYGASSAFSGLLMEGLLADLGLDFTRIPYSATADNFRDLVIGVTQVAWMPENMAFALGEPANRGDERKLRALAVTGDKRAESFPDAPTFKELGHPDIIGSSASLHVRAGTPQVAIDKIYASVVAASRQPELQAQLAKAQLSMAVSGGDATSLKLAKLVEFFSVAAKR